MRRFRPVFVALLVSVGAIALVSVPRAAHADESVDEAKLHYDKGIELSDDGAFDAALVEFERAYALHPSYRILYNIGLIRRQLNDFAAALSAFARYLDEGGAEVPPERRKDVETSIGELRALVATLTVVVDVDGAEITIDDAVVGRSPLAEAIVVNPGHHVVTATKDGRSATQRLSVAAQDAAHVELHFPVAPVVTPPPAPASASPRVPWLTWGITAALAGGAVVTGSLALRASTTLSDERRTDGISRSTLDAQQSKTKTLALVTDVLAGGALVMAGVSVYLTLVPGEPSHESSPTAATASLQLAVGPGSLGVVGAF